MASAKIRAKRTSRSEMAGSRRLRCFHRARVRRLGMVLVDPHWTQLQVYEKPIPQAVAGAYVLTLIAMVFFILAQLRNHTYVLAAFK